MGHLSLTSRRPPHLAQIKMLSDCFDSIFHLTNLRLTIESACSETNQSQGSDPHYGRCIVRRNVNAAVDTVYSSSQFFQVPFIVLCNLHALFSQVSSRVTGLLGYFLHLFTSFSRLGLLLPLYFPPASMIPSSPNQFALIISSTGLLSSPCHPPCYSPPLNKGGYCEG